MSVDFSQTALAVLNKLIIDSTTIKCLPCEHEILFSRVASLAQGVNNQGSFLCPVCCNSVSNIRQILYLGEFRVFFQEIVSSSLMQKSEQGVALISETSLSRIPSDVGTLSTQPQSSSQIVSASAKATQGQPANSSSLAGVSTTSQQSQVSLDRNSGTTAANSPSVSLSASAMSLQTQYSVPQNLPLSLANASESSGQLLQSPMTSILTTCAGGAQQRRLVLNSDEDSGKLLHPPALFEDIS